MKGFMEIHGTEIRKLYVDPCFQSGGIGKKLMEHAISTFDADHLWALEKNTRAIAFYHRHGFMENGEKELENTILSVIRQTYDNLEYIIVDGGSTDNTINIIKKYANKISYWISEPDKGLYDAMNKGLRRATGDYVWFLNAGDTLYTADTVQRIVASLKKKVSLPDVIYGETRIVDAAGKSLGCSG